MLDLSWLGDALWQAFIGVTQIELFQLAGLALITGITIAILFPKFVERTIDMLLDR